MRDVAFLTAPPIGGLFVTGPIEDCLSISQLTTIEYSIKSIDIAVLKPMQQIRRTKQT